MTSEHEIISLQKQVQQLADKLDSVDKQLKRTQHAQTEFLSRMSHELNSPLSVIIGFSQLLESSELNDDQSDNLKEIIDAANYLHDQNQHLFKLAIAKNTALNIAPVVVKDVIADVIQRFSHEIASKEINMEISNDVNSLTVNADIKYFEHIITNLIMNALHYTNQGGTVTVDSSKQDGHYQISIHDEGLGIPTQLYSEVFTLFHDRNVENVEGLGMGLYLAKEYVELMGGEIGFDSVDGQGTTFWVLIPLNDGE